MNKTLVGLVAAAGMLGCARDAPVYSPQAEVVQEGNGMTVYKSVWSNAEKLKISSYIENDEDIGILMETGWTRTEPRDSAVCLSETIEGYVDFGQHSDPNLPVGVATMQMIDTGCNGSVDLYTETAEGVTTTYTAEEINGEIDGEFADIRNFFDTDMYNLDEQVNAWHARKGL